MHLDDVLKMRFVSGVSPFHFFDVSVAVINGSDTADRARDMVEHFLGHMDRGAKLGHVAAKGPTQVVVE